MGIVYALVNPAFENFTKIGKTTNLVQRLKQLDNTSVPLPFRCVYAIEIEDENQVERLLHQTFSDYRIRSNREFFEVNAQRVISAMKLTGGKNVTPKNDIAADEEGIDAIEKSAQKRRKVYSLLEAGLSIGDTIYYSNDETITGSVVSKNKILFEGIELSLSASALILLQRDGYTWRTVNGWNFWMFENNTLAERMNNILNEQFEEGE